jgi:hypothetical protein
MAAHARFRLLISMRKSVEALGVAIEAFDLPMRGVVKVLHAYRNAARLTGFAVEGYAVRPGMAGYAL